MRKLIFVSLLFLCGFARSQIITPITPTVYGSNNLRLKSTLALHIPQKDTLLTNSTDTSAQIFARTSDSSIWAYYKPRGFFRLSSGSDFNSDDYVKKQTQNPTATLTGGEVRELMSSGADLSYTLSWSAGRAAATSTAQETGNITSITINGVTQTFSNPSAGATVIGTYTGTVVRNTNTTFTITVTTSDGKIATASTSVVFQPKRYWGFVSSSTANDATIQGLTQEFVTSITRVATSSLTPTGSQYFEIDFPASLDAGGISQIWVGGIDQTASFTISTRNFTNASGYTQNYIRAITNSLTAGSISFEIK